MCILICQNELKLKIIHKMLCNLCQSIPACEKYRIELQHLYGNDKNMYFCSGGCIEQWKTKYMCNTCNKLRTEKSYEIDGVCICSDDSCENNDIHPTCKEKYTGQFLCNLCNKNKQIISAQNHFAYIIPDNSFNTIQYRLCNDCALLYDIIPQLASVDKGNQWYGICQNSLVYKLVLNLFKTKEEQQESEFICNICDNYISIVEGIHIINHKNLCNKCCKIKNKLN